MFVVDGKMGIIMQLNNKVDALTRTELKSSLGNYVFGLCEVRSLYM
jgi:hypothetical protein